MSKFLQVFNPVANQRIDRERINLMGKVNGVVVPHVSVFLDRMLIRKVKPASSGAFECRMDLAKLELGSHEIEVRIQVKARTDRLLVSFTKMEPKEETLT